MPKNSGQESLKFEFDRKLGEDFIARVPETSGVYLFRNDKGEIIYVGKAKNLKRRLSQYRLASKRRNARKMRMIVKKCAGLEFQICADERDALLLENQYILEHRPPLNISGAFSFLYPYIGFRIDESGLFHICYTTKPEPFADFGFQLHGAYRSRLVTEAAYEALAFVLPFVGHLSPKERAQFGSIPFSRILSFRQVPKNLHGDFLAFFRGESSEVLSTLFELLLEKPSARRLASEIQEHLGSLKLFYGREALRLRTVLKARGINESFIAQRERDRMFLSHDKDLV